MSMLSWRIRNPHRSDRHRRPCGCQFFHGDRFAQEIRVAADAGMQAEQGSSRKGGEIYVAEIPTP